MTERGTHKTWSILTLKHGHISVPRAYKSNERECLMKKITLLIMLAACCIAPGAHARTTCQTKTGRDVHDRLVSVSAARRTLFSACMTSILSRSISKKLSIRLIGKSENSTKGMGYRTFSWRIVLLSATILRNFKSYFVLRISACRGPESSLIRALLLCLYTGRMRVLAIDPGYGRCGMAVIERQQNKETLLFSDCIETSGQDEFSDRFSDHCRCVFTAH